MINNTIVKVVQHVSSGLVMFFSQPDKLHSHLIELKFGFVLGCLTQLGVIFTYLETASVEILNFFLGWFFQSSIFHHLFPTESFLNLVISGVFQRIYPIKVWGSLVICGLFPGRFLNDFGLSWLGLLERKPEYPSSILCLSWESSALTFTVPLSWCLC